MSGIPDDSIKISGVLAVDFSYISLRLTSPLETNLSPIDCSMNVLTDAMRASGLRILTSITLWKGVNASQGITTKSPPFGFLSAKRMKYEINANVSWVTKIQCQSSYFNSFFSRDALENTFGPTILKTNAASCSLRDIKMHRTNQTNMFLKTFRITMFQKANIKAGRHQQKRITTLRKHVPLTMTIHNALAQEGESNKRCL